MILGRATCRPGLPLPPLLCGCNSDCCAIMMAERRPAGPLPTMTTSECRRVFAIDFSSFVLGIGEGASPTELPPDILVIETLDWGGHNIHYLVPWLMLDQAGEKEGRGVIVDEPGAEYQITGKNPATTEERRSNGSVRQASSHFCG